MKYFITIFFVCVFNSILGAQIISITNADVIERIKILNNLDKNFLVSNSSNVFQNVNRIEFYSFELFKDKLQKISFLEQNTNQKILFEFFKELYFNNNNKLYYLFSCFNYYTTTYNEIIKGSTFPEYLMLLPAVLTGYNYKYSTSKGSGIWRMNYATGKKFKLIVNDNIDERYSSYKSTVAAYNYMGHLQTLYNNFDYALFAYFSSPVAVNNRLKNLKKDEKIIDLVPKDVFLDFHFYKALIFIYYLRDELNILPVTLSYPVKTDSVHINKRFHFEPIIKVLNMSSNEFEFLNSQYKFSYSNDSNYITIPTHLIPSFKSRENEIVYQNDSLYFSKKTYIDSTYDEASETIYHTVRKGETLSQIARKYDNVTVDDIVRLNGLKSPDKIRDGKKLIIIKKQE